MRYLKTSFSSKVFDVINYSSLLIFSISALYPFLNVFFMSISLPHEANRLGFHFMPKEPTIYAYKEIIKNPYIWEAYLNTIIRVVSGTLLNVLLSLMVAYPLSKKYLPNRTFWTSIIVFTMFFSGGLIPTYLLVSKMGLLNTRFALILPGAINTFTMIIVRNYFMSLPAELEESAKLDGANDFKILFLIIIPLSKPIIATISLWYAVAHWNAWFDALIYVNKQSLMVLQVLLRKMIIEGNQKYIGMGGFIALNDEFQPTPEVIKAATIMVSSLPIIMVYPFIQKYFIKGIMVGSLKG